MRCNQLINDFLLAYTEGTLPLTQRLSFEWHLALCASCRAYLDSYRKTVDAAKSAFGDGPSSAPKPPEELVRMILASIPKSGG